MDYLTRFNLVWILSIHSSSFNGFATISFHFFFLPWRCWSSFSCINLLVSKVFSFFVAFCRFSSWSGVYTRSKRFVIISSMTVCYLVIWNLIFYFLCVLNLISCILIVFSWFFLYLYFFIDTCFIDSFKKVSSWYYVKHFLRCISRFFKYLF